MLSCELVVSGIFKFLVIVVFAVGEKCQSEPYEAGTVQCKFSAKTLPQITAASDTYQIFNFYQSLILKAAFCLWRENKVVRSYSCR